MADLEIPWREGMIEIAPSVKAMIPIPAIGDPYEKALILEARCGTDERLPDPQALCILLRVGGLLVSADGESVKPKTINDGPNR